MEKTSMDETTLLTTYARARRHSPEPQAIVVLKTGSRRSCN